MRALQFAEYGGPEVLSWAEAAVPHAGPGQIRIAVRAASVNPVDWKLLTGAMSGGQPLAGTGYLGYDAAALWADLQEQRRTSMRTYVRALARKTELREDVRTVTETMWAMIPAIYLRLVRDAGWPPDRFETWLGETFIQLWLP